MSKKFSQETPETWAWWERVKAAKGLRRKKYQVVACWTDAEGRAYLRLGPQSVVVLPADSPKANPKEWFPQVPPKRANDDYFKRQHKEYGEGYKGEPKASTDAGQVK